MADDFTGGRSKEEIPPMPEVLKGVDWFWCGCSKFGAVVHCLECGNSSCNGGGCDKCHDVFEAAIAYHRHVTRDECIDEPNLYWKYHSDIEDKNKEVEAMKQKGNEIKSAYAPPEKSIIELYKAQRKKQAKEMARRALENLYPQRPNNP